MVALPKIIYGLATWYLPPNKQEGKTKQSSSTTILRNLQKNTKNGNTCNHRNTQNVTQGLSRHACEHPPHGASPEEKLPWRCYLTPHPSGHKSHPQYHRLFPPKKHFNPLFSLLKIFKLTNLHIETIIPTSNLLMHKIRCHTQIDNTRKDSIKTESNDNTDYKIFSDGSCYNNGIGAAAVLFANNRHSSIKELQKYLGPPKDHTTSQPEGEYSAACRIVVECIARP